MKTRMNVVFFLLIVATVASVVGCSGGGGGPFFVAETVYSINGFVKPDPQVGVTGTANAPSLYCTQNPNGTNTFSSTTDSNAQYTVQNAALGGTVCTWTLNRGASANCPNPNAAGVTAYVLTSGVTINVPCNAVTLFNATPRYVDSINPPSTITISGPNITATYGMPQVTVYDVNQNAVLTVTATGVATDGTSLTIPGSQVASLSDGAYGGVVYVKQSNGTWNSVGGAGINVYTPSGGGGGGGGCKPGTPCPLNPTP